MDLRALLLDLRMRAFLLRVHYTVEGKDVNWITKVINEITEEIHRMGGNHECLNAPNIEKQNSKLAESINALNNH